MGRPCGLTVALMNDPASGLSCYLVEWYPAELSEEILDRTLARLHDGAEAMSANGSSAKVLMTLAVPTDEVIFCVFMASSSEIRPSVRPCRTPSRTRHRRHGRLGRLTASSGRHILDSCLPNVQIAV